MKGNSDMMFCLKEMADDDEKSGRKGNTFMKTAVKFGMVVIPLTLYATWAYKKFRPCSPVRCHRAKNYCQPMNIAKAEDQCDTFESTDCAVQEKQCDYQDNPEHCEEPSENAKKGTFSSFFEDDFKDHLRESQREIDLSKLDTEKFNNALCNPQKQITDISECKKILQAEEETSTEKSVENQKSSEDNDRVPSPMTYCEYLQRGRELSKPKTKDDNLVALTPELLNCLCANFSKYKNQPHYTTASNHRPAECIEEDKATNRECDMSTPKLKKIDQNNDTNHCDNENPDECDSNFHLKGKDIPYVVRDYRCKPGLKGKRNDNGNSRRDKCKEH